MPLPLPPVAEREGEARQRHGVEQAPHRERVTQTHKALVKDEVDREPLAKVAAMDNVAQMLVIRPVVAPDDRLPHAGIRRVSRLHQHKALAVRARGSRADSREPGLQDDALVQLVDERCDGDPDALPSSHEFEVDRREAWSVTKGVSRIPSRSPNHFHRLQGSFWLSRTHLHPDLQSTSSHTKGKVVLISAK